MVVVVIVPMLTTPLVTVFVPPALVFVPAALANLCQFVAIFLRFLTVRAMMGNGVVEFMIDSFGVVLAIVSQRTNRGEDN